MPESLSSKHARSCWMLRRKRKQPPGGVNLMALSTRLLSTSSNKSGSPKTWGVDSNNSSKRSPLSSTKGS